MLLSSRWRSLAACLMIIGIVAGTVVVVQSGRPRPTPVLDNESREILETGDHFVLLSIDPYSRPNPNADGEVNRLATETFHDYKVLGKVEINDQAERMKLLNAVATGIANSYNVAAATCFDPRHGIRAVLGDRIVDVVICFQCSQVEVHTGQEKHRYLITEEPQSVLNATLVKAKVPLAPTTYPSNTPPGV